MPEATPQKKISKTAPVRRGMRTIIEALAIATNDDAPPLNTAMSRWSTQKVQEYRKAIAWLDQNAEPLPSAQVEEKN